MKKIRTVSVFSTDDKEWDNTLSNGVNYWIEEIKITPENLIDIKYNTVFDPDFNKLKFENGIVETALIIYLQDE